TWQSTALASPSVTARSRGSGRQSTSTGSSRRPSRARSCRGRLPGRDGPAAASCPPQALGRRRLGLPNGNPAHLVDDRGWQAHTRTRRTREAASGRVPSGSPVVSRGRPLMSANFGSGLHAAPGRTVDTFAYERYIGRWSRLFVPTVLAAAEVAGGDRVVDVAAGPGEARRFRAM